LKGENFLKEKFLVGIIFKCKEKWAMTEELIVKWLREFWDRRTEQVLI
jgi:hypothetical protein